MPNSTDKHGFIDLVHLVAGVLCLLLWMLHSLSNCLPLACVGLFIHIHAGDTKATGLVCSLSCSWQNFSYSCLVLVSQSFYILLSVINPACYLTLASIHPLACYKIANFVNSSLNFAFILWSGTWLLCLTIANVCLTLDPLQPDAQYTVLYELPSVVLLNLSVFLFVPLILLVVIWKNPCIQWYP